MKHLEIRGIGTSVPQHSISQDDAAGIARQFQYGERPVRVLTKLYQRTGVGTRHSIVLDSSTNGESARQTFFPPAESNHDQGPKLSARMHLYESSAGRLACEAAQQALDTAQIRAHDVTHLISVSCTGFAAPGFDIELCQRLPLPDAIARTHIGFMGCHAMLNALRVAKAFVSADENAVVMICAVELCSLHQQYGAGADRIVSNALFGDGAAAMICRRGGLTGASRPWQHVACASKIISGTNDQMTWKLGDHGFQMSLSAEVPNWIQRKLRDWLVPWLAQQGFGLDGIGQWAVHPGGPRILDAIETSLELDDEALAASREVLRRYGNMSSPTVAFVLERLGTMRATGPCVMLGFGPGLAIEAALLR